MTKTYCDGPCGRELRSNARGENDLRKPATCLIIERVDGLTGGGIPGVAGGKSHLCNDCALLAFQAFK